MGFYLPKLPLVVIRFQSSVKYAKKLSSIQTINTIIDSYYNISDSCLNTNNLMTTVPKNQDEPYF